jgi:DNA (cytosine-5)-methyltransferase 1
MRHLDLFSGIGGFSLAAEWVWGKEHNIVAFVEQDKYCQKRLKDLWPDVPIFEDIKTFDGKQYTDTIDLLTGGFPCQPFSVAGKRKGKEDDRALWPEMLRIIQEAKPTWIIGENVTGIINMELDNYITDLESEEYEVQPFNIPACGIDAKHRRERIWIVANSRGGGFCEQNIFGQQQGGTEAVSTGENMANSEKPRSLPTAECGTDNREQPRMDINKKGQWSEIRSNTTGRGEQIVTDTEEKRLQGVGTRGKQVAQTHEGSELSMCGSSNGAIWHVEPDVGRVAHGIPNRVDRLKALGNAIVPQVVVPIMQAIREIEDSPQRRKERKGVIKNEYYGDRNKYKSEYR